MCEKHVLFAPDVFDIDFNYSVFNMIYVFLSFAIFYLETNNIIVCKIWRNAH